VLRVTAIRCGAAMGMAAHDEAPSCPIAAARSTIGSPGSPVRGSCAGPPDNATLSASNRAGPSPARRRPCPTRRSRTSSGARRTPSGLSHDARPTRCWCATPRPRWSTQSPTSPGAARRPRGRPSAPRDRHADEGAAILPPQSRGTPSVPAGRGAPERANAEQADAGRPARRSDGHGPGLARCHDRPRRCVATRTGEHARRARSAHRRRPQPRADVGPPPAVVPFPG
jgi:hypothetical protein